LGHTVTFAQLFITFNLLEIDNETGERTHLLVKLPNKYFINSTNELHWTNQQILAANEDQIVSIFVAPILPSKYLHKSTQVVSNNTHFDDDNTQPPPANTITTKPAPPLHKTTVSSQLLHHRLGHRSIAAINVADKDNIWADIKVQPDPKTICTTCQMTLSRKSNQNTTTPNTYPSVPG
jgi:hypothetical protein